MEGTPKVITGGNVLRSEMHEEILDGVYDVTWQAGGGSRYRSFVFDDDPPLLVDTCHDNSTDTLIEGIDGTGVGPERLVVTHGDPDHVGGYDTIVEHYGLETWVPEESSLDADHPYQDGDLIGRFEAVHIPGHAADATVLVDEDASLAVFGDCLVGADMRGLPAGYLILPPEVYTDDLHAAEQNLERLLDYDFDTALVFHGSSVLNHASDRIEAYVDFPGKP